MANTKVTGDLIASSTIATGNIADNAVTSDKISGITTAHITEGSNLYYTNARADARITAATTSDLSEGTNLYYTDARADARAALLVDSAPSTLDTLNELAAALGDDPNFATTTANSIGLKAPLASPSFTGAVTIPGAISAGTNGGLRIHSSGTKFFNVTAANAARNNIMDIGASDAKFKDLYLGGKILVGTGATAAASLNAYTQTVSTNLYSALRVIENSGASSYWDIGATNAANTLLNFYHNGSTTPKIIFTHTGGATFAGNVDVTGSIIARVNANYYSTKNYLGDTWEFASDTADGVTFKITGGAANTTGNFFKFQTQAGGATPATALTINKNGNVGIGATPNDWDPTITALQIDAVSISAFLNNVMLISGNAYYDDTANAYKYINDGFASQLTVNNSGNFEFKTAGSGTAVGTVSFDTKVKILNNGNVGIGITSTDSRLTVSSGTANNVANFKSTDGTAYIAISDNSSSSALGNQVGVVGDQMYFAVGDVERMRLVPDGNSTFVIIKAKPATYNSKSFITLYGTNSSTYGGSVIARSSISSETDGSAYGANLKFYTNDSSNVEQTRMLINSSGDVGIGTTPQASGPTWRTLFVGASAVIVSRQSAAGYDSIFANNYYVNSSNQDRVRVNAPSSRMFLDGNNIRFQISPTNSTAPSWSEIMRIDGSGDVGIGVTGPGAKLDVAGIIRSKGNNNYENILTKEGSTGSFTFTQTELNAGIIDNISYFIFVSVYRPTTDVANDVGTLLLHGIMPRGGNSIFNTINTLKGAGISVLTATNSSNSLVITTDSNVNLRCAIKLISIGGTS